jgi:hypothetical protein
LEEEILYISLDQLAASGVSGLIVLVQYLKKLPDGVPLFLPGAGRDDTPQPVPGRQE